MKSNRRSDAVVPAASGALAILPGWAFSGPFSWGAEAGHDPAAAERLLHLDTPRAGDPSSDTLPYRPDIAAATEHELGGSASGRRVVAAEVLWQGLSASSFEWQRAIALEGRLLSFYCPSARVALEILDPKDPGDAFGGSESRGAGIRVVPISIADVEQRCATVVGWLDALCAGRSGQHSPTSEQAAHDGRWRRRRRDSQV